MVETEEVTLTTQEEEPAATEEDLGEVILGVPVQQIPPPPWTVKDLGWEQYCFLANFGGYLRPSAEQMPDIDPRTFAHGVAYKKIEKLLFISAKNATAVNKRRQTITQILDGRLDAKSYCTSDAAYVEVCWVVEQCQLLKARLDELHGPTKGTPYNQSIVDAHWKVARKLIQR